MNGNDLWKALGEISKEFMKIPMEGDRLRNFQQGTIPPDMLIRGLL
jgi:hypothetical protein